MQYKDFSLQIWNQIHATLADLKKSSKTQLYAAFDADGTLWDTDLGENMFRYQIKNQLVKLPDEAWQHYRDIKKVDPKKAFLWLAQVNQGVKISRVREWAESAVEQYNPLPIFSAQQKLIELLLQNDVNVMIVTASVAWAVEPGARRIGVERENVLGVATKIENDIVTDENAHTITYRDGKIKRVLEFTGGVAPFLCSGNTMGDYELLKGASHISLAVSAAKESSDLFATEMELQKNANEHNWLAHLF